MVFENNPSELGPALPFPPMRVLEVQWSRALNRVCEKWFLFVKFGHQTTIELAEFESLCVKSPKFLIIYKTILKE